MARAILIEGLPLRVTLEDLKTLCGQYGTVVWARVPTDHLGRSLGYGYVEMGCETDAQEVINALDGTYLDDCCIQASALSVDPFITYGDAASWQ